MGCVSSALLNQDDDFAQIGGSALGHHIVSLTSTTYGLLTLDPPSDRHQPPTLPPTPPSRFTLASVSASRPPEVINSWELMAGLDTTPGSFRFSSLPPPLPQPCKLFPVEGWNKENSNPNLPAEKSTVFRPSDPDGAPRSSSAVGLSLDGFEKLCPPSGENRVVIYTTTLRGVRKTFEACNAVRAALEGVGVAVCERDISMDRGFREELRELMNGRESSELVPPRVFVKGRYVGGGEEVMRIVEEGNLGELLRGLPRLKPGFVCEGCGGVRFLPCFSCNGSCKMVMLLKEETSQTQSKAVVVTCPDCNENGLVLCPICS